MSGRARPREVARGDFLEVISFLLVNLGVPEPGAARFGGLVMVILGLPSR